MCYIRGKKVVVDRQRVKREVSMKKYILGALVFALSVNSLISEEPVAKEEKLILGVTVLKKDIEDAGKLNRLLKVNATNQIVLKDLGIFIGKLKKYYNLQGLENLLKKYKEKEFSILIPLIENLIEKNTALLKAVAEGNLEQANDWLAAGADPNARAKSDFTALMLAALKGNQEIIKVLLDAGADKNIKAGIIKKQTASDVAKKEGKTEVVELIRVYRPKPKKATQV